MHLKCLITYQNILMYYSSINSPV